MPITPIDCSKMIIYKIQHNEKPELLYIGSTTNFKMRKNKHKAACNKETSKSYNTMIYKMIRENGGWDNFTMIQIKEFPCNNRRESEAEEYKLMHELKASMNVNKYSGEQKSIRFKEYRQNNITELTLYDKERYQKNKEYHRIHNKEYKEKNKEVLAIKQKEKFECICGGKYIYIHKLRHFNCKKHLKYIAENLDVIPSN